MNSLNNIHSPQPFFIMQSLTRSIWLMLSLALCSCVPEDITIDSPNDKEDVNESTVLEPKSFAGVHPSLWGYFEAFEKEAAQRGIDIDLQKSELTGVIQDLEGERVAGQCNYHSLRPNHVIIDHEFWENASDLVKEMVVFHELGHCELARGHREATGSRGHCLSIMRSGGGKCLDNYRFATRKAYLDELFNDAFFNTIGQ